MEKQGTPISWDLMGHQIELNGVLHQIDFVVHLCKIRNVEDIDRTEELKEDNRDYYIVSMSCIQLEVDTHVEHLVA